jgi:hypothetical protein
MLEDEMSIFYHFSGGIGRTIQKKTDLQWKEDVSNLFENEGCLFILLRFQEA